MITKTDRIKLKRFFKKPYTADVLKKLSERQYFNKKGKPFSKSYITHVYNGIRQEDTIEEVILELYQERKKEFSKLKTLRAIKKRKVFKK